MPLMEQLTAESWDRPLPAVSPRLVKLPDIADMAQVVIGMRRSGKTYLLFQEMRRLAQAGVDRKSMLYLNFEDDRLQPLGGDVLNTMLDTESVRLYISGSSAKMLSTEVSTEFRGRGFAVELLPFSFAETLLYRGMTAPTSAPGAPERSALEAAFVDYLRVGGFPAVQQLGEAERIQTLQDYVQLVLLRDVIERHGMRNAHAVRYFALALLQSVGSPTSVNKLTNDLKSRGVAVSKDTLHELLGHFVDAFLLFTIPIYNRSLRVREANPRKSYAIDPGLAFAMMPMGIFNQGARLENAVYLELRRRLRGTREGAISYYSTSSGYEVDFIVGHAESEAATQLVQVCADLSLAETRDREIRALDEAMRETGLTESTIVTLYEYDRISTPAGTVSLVPAWRWCLELE